jgi:hypothetical protein
MFRYGETPHHIARLFLVMPYSLRKEHDGYRVVNQDTGKTYSHAPIPKKKAEAQLRVLEATLHGGDEFDEEPTVTTKPTEEVYHAAAEGAYGNPPQQIDGWQLVWTSPTLNAYAKNRSVLLAIRGTFDTQDIYADTQIPFGRLEQTPRYKTDLSTVRILQEQYPPTEFTYYATGHSLGGAIVDAFLRNGLIRSGTSFNPAVAPSEMGRKSNVNRIFNEDDPLYNTMGRFANIPEVIKPKDWLPRSPLAAHSIETFANRYLGKGKSKGAFEEQLKESGLSPSAYLLAAQRAAKKAGYPYKLLGFADDGVHKLAIPNHDGHIVKFGRVGYGDYILWSNEDEDYAEQKKRTFHASHEAIKGNWKKDPFSPNSLALAILW